jgi:CxxC motif-containing protein
MSGERTMICVVCPIGCRLQLEAAEGVSPMVRGNRCKRGIGYAESELTDPRRVLTSVVRIEREANGVAASNGHPPAMLPCKSTAPVPKGLIPGILADLRKLRVLVPIREGDIILANPRDCGCDIVATRTMEE